MSRTPYQLAIVIPVFNAANTLPSLVKQLQQILQLMQVDYQVIFVNDGSRDNSLLLLKKLSSQLSAVTIIDLADNFGQHNATLCGIKHSNSQYVVTIDDDLQYEPHVIQQLYREITYNNQADVVIGIPSTRQSPRLNRLGSYLCNRFLMPHQCQHKRVKAGSLRILAANIVQHLKQNNEANPSIGAELFLLTNRIVNISVPHSPRNIGHSGYTFKKLLSQYCNMQLAYKKTWLKLVRYFMGGILLIALSIYCIYLITIHSFTSHVNVNTILDGSIICLLLGFSLFRLLLTKQLALHLFAKLRGLPQYQIQEVVNTEP